MADKGKDPLPIFKKSISLTKKNKNIEILWASTREAYNYIQAKQIKCNIITMPPKVIKQINNFGKSLKLMTLDTVKGFLIDSKKSKFKNLNLKTLKTLIYIQLNILKLNCYNHH